MSKDNKHSGAHALEQFYSSVCFTAMIASQQHHTWPIPKIFSYLIMQSSSPLSSPCLCGTV